MKPFQTRHCKTAFALLLLLALITAGLTFAVPPAQAISTTVVISQVYGGGGNSGASYKNDYIELFNLGSGSVDLSTWSVQYGGATGTTWQLTNLTGTVQAGHYYLIQEAAGAGGTTNLPTPDATGTIPMGSTAGKVALVNNQTVLSVACPTGANIIDFVGFGTTANCYEGSGATPAPSNTAAALRAGNGCTDTDNNATDFTAGALNPRNSSSTATCAADTTPPTVTSTDPADGATGIAPSANVTVNFSEPVNVTASSFTLSCASSGAHTLTPTGSPASSYIMTPSPALASGESCTGTVVAANVTDLANNPMAGNYGWSFTTSAASIPPSGTGSANPASVSQYGSTVLTVAVTPGSNPASGTLDVICDLSPIGGSATQALSNGGSGNNFTYTATVDPATSAGSKSIACSITDSARAGQTFSVSPFSLAVTQVITIGAVNGPVADADNALLHRSQYAPSTGNFAGTTVITTTGVIYEKTLQATSSGGTSYGFFMQSAPGKTDGNSNTSDGLFVYMGSFSTLLRADGGAPYTPQVGDEIVLGGKISEYYYYTELSSSVRLVAIVRSGVNIDSEIAPVEVNPPANGADSNRYYERLQSMRVQVPQNAIVTGGRNVFNPADAEIWLTRADSTVAGRSDPFARRAFRDSHPLDDNYDPNNWDGNGYRMLMGSLGIKFTENNKQALISPARTFDTVTNTPAGGLNYTYSKYRIEVSTQPAFSHGVDPSTNNPPPVVNRDRQYSIVDYNLENLYDYRDNPFSGCDFTNVPNTSAGSNPKCDNANTPFTAAVTPASDGTYNYVPGSDAEYQARLKDIAYQIINDLHGPDILMVQEVENQDICTPSNGTMQCVDPQHLSGQPDGKPDALQDLALKIASLGGPAYDAAFDHDSSDLRGILPAYLFRTDRVELLPAAGDPVLGADPAVSYAGTTVPANGDVSNPKTLNAVLPTTFVSGDKCETNWVFPRAPLVGLFRIYQTAVGQGHYSDVYLINNHFKSGPDTCVKHRTEQARYNAALIAYLQAQKPAARIVIGGDLNVYPRPDDPVARPAAPTDQLGALYDPALGLKNLWEVVLSQAPASAYSYVYLGMAQTLDQMFVNQAMLNDLYQAAIAHINSDFPADNPDDGARGTSDHDPTFGSFNLANAAPNVNANGPYQVDEGSTATLNATGGDPDGDALTFAWDLNNDGTFETTGQSVTFDATNLDGPSAHNIKVQVTDTFGTTATNSSTVTVNNVAPTATFNAPATPKQAIAFTLSLTNPFDPSNADVQAGFKYSFNCGDGMGYNAFSTKNSRVCLPATFGTRTVKAKIKDKDGGETEYKASIFVLPRVRTDLSIVKTVKASTTQTNVLLYSLKVVNNGLYNAYTVYVGDVLPPEVQFVTATTSVPGRTCSYNATTRKVLCGLGTVLPRATPTITIKVNWVGGPTATNCATVKALTYDANPSNNISCITHDGSGNFQPASSDQAPPDETREPVALLGPRKS